MGINGHPVDSVTSNSGHLLGTALLNHEESALIATRLSAPDLDSGHGLRTLSSESASFNPHGYHTGSVWPHDTAIAAHGLVRAGFPQAAASLAAGLLTASADFGARLPNSSPATAPKPTPAPRPTPPPADHRHGQQRQPSWCSRPLSAWKQMHPAAR
jgi:glycogen debranching enzyme